MKKTDSLEVKIKILKKDLDEKTIKLKEMQEYIEKLEFMISALKKELEKESKIENIEHFKDVTLNYIESNLSRQKLIASEISVTENKIEKLKDEIKDIFAEIKKYEIILQNRKEALLKQEEKKQQQENDEVAIMKFFSANFMQDNDS